MNLEQRIKASIATVIAIGGMAFYFYYDNPIGLVLFIVALPSYYSLTKNKDEEFYALSQNNLLPQFKDIVVIKVKHVNGLKIEIKATRLQRVLKRMRGLKKVNSVLIPDSTFQITMIDKWGGEFPLQLIQAGGQFEFVVRQIHLKNRHTDNFGKEISS